MKNYFKTIILAAAVAASAACSMEDVAYMANGVFLSGPYIQNYYDGELALQVNDTSAALPMLTLGVHLNGDTPVKVYGSGTTEYKTLCGKHSDTAFEGEDYHYNDPAKLCFAHDLKSIDLVCDNDFDAAHPAGTSLLDVMTYSASSLTRWIRNGYQMADFEDECFILDKKADTLEPDDLSLLCYFSLFQLQFVSEPELPGTHSFTLTVIYDDGQMKKFPVKAAF